MDRPRRFYHRGRRLRTADGILRGFVPSQFPSFAANQLSLSLSLSLSYSLP